MLTNKTLTTKLDVSQRDYYLDRFLNIVGPDIVVKRYQSLHQMLSENELLEDYIYDRHSYEMALFDELHYIGNHNEIRKSIVHKDMYRLYSLIAMVVQLYDHLGPAGKNKLKGRLIDGFKTEVGLAPIETEITVLIHCLNKGFDVYPNDIENNGGFDFLATKNNLEIEIECELESADLGRPIHIRKAKYLFNRLLIIRDLPENQEKSKHIIITFETRLSGNHKDQEHIVEGVIQAIKSGVNYYITKNFTIHISEVELTSKMTSLVKNKIADENSLRIFVEETTGLKNKEATAIINSNDELIIITLDSRQKVKVLGCILKELKKATKKQLTGKRPGILVVQLIDIKPHELIQLSTSNKNKPNAFEYIAQKLFDSENRTHLHSVAFISSQAMEKSRIYTSPINLRYHVTGSGRSYTFRNINNEYCDVDDLNIFSE